MINVKMKKDGAKIEKIHGLDINDLLYKYTNQRSSNMNVLHCVYFRQRSLSALESTSFEFRFMDKYSL